jgi:hypothetical protein
VLERAEFRGVIVPVRIDRQAEFRHDEAQGKGMDNPPMP